MSLQTVDADCGGSGSLEGVFGKVLANLLRRKKIPLRHYDFKMIKNNEVTGNGRRWSHQLAYPVIPEAWGGEGTIRVEEYGVSGKSILSENVLWNNIAYEKTDDKEISVYLCYDWKSHTPFILVERFDYMTRREYNAQYGRDDNYIEVRHLLGVSMKFYNIPELAKREPEIAAIINTL